MNIIKQHKKKTKKKKKRGEKEKKKKAEYCHIVHITNSQTKQIVLN